MKQLKVGESVMVRCVKQGETGCVSEDGRQCDFYDMEDCAGFLGCDENTVFLIEPNEP